jgi:hypothetical protein
MFREILPMLADYFQIQQCQQTVQLNKEEASELKNKLKGPIKQYAPKNVFNVDETALFFRALPTKTSS